MLLVWFLSICAAIHAASIPTVGCLLNGTMFGEGSAMATSSHCEYCYCIKGKQHCVRPQCLLDVAGCSPEYSQHSCCPVKYICSDLRLSTIMSTTTKSSVKITGSGTNGCQINGLKYSEGDKVEASGKQCESCYCLQGKVRCEPIICPVPLKQCTPITTPGHCCPTSYDCSDLSKETTESTTPNEENEETTTESIPMTVTSDTTAFEIDSNNIETSTIVEIETTQDLLTLQLNDTEQRSVTEGNEYASTVQTIQPDTTTIVADTTNATTANVSSPVRSIPDVIEAIINRTLAKDEDYEYDYNEPSLPPSLPNLKIIPFVAADAVINDDDMKGKTDEPVYFDYPQPSRFSPPSKTEGGFVPRDPIIDGPFYESKFEKPYISNNGDQIELSSETQQLPPITEPPKLFEEGKCIYHEKTYHHGEVVSEPNACELCVCYYGQSYCQKPKCSPVKEGCRRLSHDNDNSCCGRIVCGTMPTKVIDNLEISTQSTLIPESMSNIPAITVADLVVTPDPFRDVIRTEPAPNLVDIMKDMLPHLKNESSTVMPIVTVLQNSLNRSKFNNNIDSKLKPSNTQALENVTKNSEILTNNATKENVNSQSGDYGKNSSKIDEDDDSFSFESVLDMLFHSRDQITTTKVPSTTSTKTSFNNIYNHQSNNRKQEINNAIEITDVDYISTKEKATEKSPDFIIFEDYQADESKNGTKDNLNSFKNKKETIRSDINKETPNVTAVSKKTIKDEHGSGMQLKLAGCNIYGRMYEVGQIISELSGPCLECMCTEFGVQCRKLC